LIQKLIGNEAQAVLSRLEKEKSLLGLTSVECDYCFYNYYLLPCRYIFHEDMYGRKLLIADRWADFQQLFAESDFEIYESRERVEILEHKGEEQQTNIRHTRFNELVERLQDCYWRVEEAGNVNEAIGFVDTLAIALENVL